MNRACLIQLLAAQLTAFNRVAKAEGVPAAIDKLAVRMNEAFEYDAPVNMVAEVCAEEILTIERTGAQTQRAAHDAIGGMADRLIRYYSIFKTERAFEEIAPGLPGGRSWD